MTGRRSAYLLERAWVDGAVRDDVLVEIADGRFTAVTLAPPVGRGEGDAPLSDGVSPSFHRPTGETRALADILERLSR